MKFHEKEESERKNALELESGNGKLARAEVRVCKSFIPQKFGSRQLVDVQLTLQVTCRLL